MFASVPDQGDDVDDFSTPEDVKKESSKVDPTERGPTNAVPFYKRVQEEDGYPPFLKKARLGGTFEIQLAPFKRSPVPLENIALPWGCSDWDMAFNVAMWYVDCPVCLGYEVCETCGRGDE